jgi:hypothetical protein
LNQSEENSRNEEIISKFGHKTFKFKANKLIEIVVLDNFDLDFSSFKKLISNKN